MKVFVKEFKVINEFRQKLRVDRYLVVKDNCGGEYLHVSILSNMLSNNTSEFSLLIKIENLWE